MTFRRRRTTIAAMAAITALTIAACGTRLDHATIVTAAAGAGTAATTADGGGEYGTDPGVATDDPGADGAEYNPTAPGATATGPGTPGATGGRTGANSRGRSGKSGPGGSGKPIVIGSVGTYSGPVGVAQVPASRALQIWAAAVNANGGINGRKVQVIVYDDGGDGAKAKSQVRDLVEQRNGVAVVASMSSLTLPSWRGYVEQRRIPVVGGDCSLELWHSSPMLFSQCSSIDAQIFGVVKLGARLGKGKKWGMLTCTEAELCSYAEDKWFGQGYAKKAGLEPVYRSRISVAQPDFTSECLQARNAGVQLFTVVGDPNTVARVAASCRRQNFNPQFLQGSATVTANTATQPGLSDVLAYMPTFPFAGLSTGPAKEFHTAYAKYGGGAEPGGAASLGWAAAKLFEQAARNAGADVSSAGILKGLHTIRNDRLGGLTVPLGFAPGKPGSDAGCWFVMQAINGKWTAPQGDRLDCR